MTRLPFWCSHCGSYDRRNWSTGGCRYFDDWPEGRASGVDPPCALEELDEDDKQRRRHNRFVWLAIAAVLLLLVIAGMVTTAAAQERGQWFKSLKTPGGTSCCDVSDCKRTEAFWKNGAWQAKSVSGAIVTVPHSKVLVEPSSIDGDAYLCEGPAGSIYCFVPPDFGT